MRVVFLASARRDLRAIGDWIAQDDPRRADSFVAELEARAAALTDLPERGPVAFRSARPAIHKLTHRKYLIYYRVLPTRVEVIAIRHGAQRPPRFD